MERKVGEIFEYNGEWYQCVVAIQGCRECSFRTHDYCTRHLECLSDTRSDKTSVIFKKLEKVGEPYSCNYYGDNRLIMMQEYNLFKLDDVTNEDKIPMYITDYKHKRIAIEIKQTKEDMEEKKQKWGVSSDTINEINKGIEPMNASRNIDTERSGAEGIRRNLKPFNLEAAKSGKPVCTRDGRKARIICFDRKFYHDGYNYPIVAIVNDNDNELVHTYTQDGLLVGNMEVELDLMMLSEKKEGWVNVYNSLGVVTFSHNPYDTKEEALADAKPKDYVDTVKINWEE